MSSPFLLVAAFGIGVIAGLRTMMAPAAASWLAHIHGANFEGSRLAFMGSTLAVVVFSVAAVAELVADKLPKTPNRTAPGPFVARLLTGALAAATLSAGAGSSTVAGGLLGMLGALVGTLCGYLVRTRSVKRLNAPDLVIALAEDTIAVGGAFFFAFRR